jgi:hypothetical protein
VAVGVGVGLGIAGSRITSPYIYDPLVDILSGGPTAPLPPLPGERRQPEPGEGPEPEPGEGPQPRPGPGGGCPPSSIFQDEYDNPGDAIGDTSAQGPTRAGNTEVTKDRDIYGDGYTQTQYWRGSDGVKYTVFYNPCNGNYAGAHRSGSQGGGPTRGGGG